MSKAEIEKATPPVPALASTPAFDFDRQDIQLPRIRRGEFQSQIVQDGVVPPGCLFSTLGQDDPDPVVLAEEGKPLRIHVLAMRKGKSITVDGELFTYDFGDPSAPQDAWTTYNYVCFVPSGERDLPYKFLLTKTSRPAAQQINTVIQRNQGTVEPAALAFEVWTEKRKKDTYQWFVVKCRPVDAVPADVAEATALAAQVADAVAASTPSQPANEPAI